MHERSIVHLDLAPKNLLMQWGARHGLRLKIADLGLACNLPSSGLLPGCQALQQLPLSDQGRGGGQPGPHAMFGRVHSCTAHGRPKASRLGPHLLGVGQRVFPMESGTLSTGTADSSGVVHPRPEMANRGVVFTRSQRWQIAVFRGHADEFSGATQPRRRQMPRLDHHDGL